MAEAPGDAESIDLATLDRIVEVLQRRDAKAPDAERAAALVELRHIRNMIAHSAYVAGIPADYTRLAMFTFLTTLELTSLGAENARRIRAQATAARVAEILDRSEEPGPR